MKSFRANKSFSSPRVRRSSISRRHRNFASLYFSQFLFISWRYVLDRSCWGICFFELGVLGMLGGLHKTAKGEFLSWCGVIGLAITLFDSFDSFIRLSKAAQWFVENWKEVFSEFWSFFFLLFGIDLPREAAPFFTFMGFLLSIAGGARLAYKHARLVDGHDSTEDSDLGRRSGALFIQFVSVVPFFALLFTAADNKFVSMPAALLPIIVFVLMGEKPLRRAFVAVVVIASFVFIVMPETSRYERHWEWNAALGKCELIIDYPGRPFLNLATVATFLALPTLPLIAPERFVAARLRHAIFGLIVLLLLNWIATTYDRLRPEAIESATPFETYMDGEGDEADFGYEPDPCSGLGFPDR